ncbi:FtsK/SpoIIIE family DNA translocase [Clostridium grantii]|uniref:DNA translocase FtsK n=1 Tax=Clostridium grantii DSM 8605 TaxID=1121316 RepID=A0A1M5QXN6_9CLOT|nr:DNA translocase FtsK [Clostridium grantii]SHH18681.1 DNA translocase FtsK [Clostridium grantii DSM 8605]
MTKRMNKKTKDNRNIKSKKINSDIKGIIYSTVGVLMLMSIFFSTSSGILGKTSYKLLFTVFGIGAYIFPVILILVGISIIFSKGKLKYNTRFFGILLFIINTLLFIQMVTLLDFYYEKDILIGINNIYNSSSVLHGGVLGFLIDVPLYSLFGKAGSYIIFTSFYIISLILIFEISLHKLFVSIYDNMKDKRKETSEKRPNKEVKEVKEEIFGLNKNEKEKFIGDLNKKIKILDFMKKNNMEEVAVENNNESDIKFDEVKYNNEEIKEEIKEGIKEESIIFNIDDGMDVKSKKKEKVDEKSKEEVFIEIKENNLYQETEYRYPPLDLLKFNPFSKSNKGDKKDLLKSAKKLEETLESFGVVAKVIQVIKGPTVTRYELQPNSGVKVSKIVNLSDDISLSLAAISVRIEAPIPGKSAVGIEIPNDNTYPVYLREVIDSEEFKNSPLNVTFALGKDIGGNCIVSDLNKMPHMLIAGATGSGKSVCINTLLISLLYKYSPEDVKLLLIDPKMVELNVYNGIPHLLIPVVTQPKKAAGALHWAVTEMTRRYQLFADSNTRNIEGYNELFIKGKVEDKLPWIIIVIDELADLMMVCAGEVEEYIGRLAQMARAAGMHLVIATQRPSVDVITGVIKANIPSRISFSVSSQIDSRTILDSSGAEKLLGKGDMLFLPVGASKPLRIQGAFISDEEVEKIVDYIKIKEEAPKYEEKIMEEINKKAEGNSDEEDELIEEAIDAVLEAGQASASFLQRKFRIGYNRAARLIDQMEDRGVISGRNGSKPRQILIDEKEMDN